MRKLLLREFGERLVEIEKEFGIEIAIRYSHCPIHPQKYLEQEVFNISVDCEIKPTTKLTKKGYVDI